MASVNTNFGASIALQNLNTTNRDLDSVQQRISTGLKIGSARDNGAIFAIAEGQRGRVSALASVRDGIDRGNTVIDTALAAGKSIGTVLQELRTKAVDAQQSDLSAGQKATLQRDFDALRSQINQIANAATFNGANLVNGANAGVTTSYRVLTSDIGGESSGGSGSFTATGAAYSTTSITAGSQVLDQLSGIQADDTVTFTFGYEDSTVVDTTATISVESGETVQQFVDRVSTATSGRVQASFDADSGRISYSSTEAFRTTTSFTTTSGAAEAFLGANRSANSTAGDFSVTTNQAIANDYTRTVDTNDATVTTATLLSALDNVGIADGDTINFFDGSGQNIGTVTLAAADDVASLISKVAAATDGVVQLELVDGGTGVNDSLVYRSANNFSATFTDLSGGLETGADVIVGTTTAASELRVTAESSDLTQVATGIQAGDKLSFRDTNGNSIGDPITFAAGTTAQSLIDSVYTETNGRIRAQLNDDGTFTYRSNEAFEVVFSETATNVAGSQSSSGGAAVAGSSVNGNFEQKTTASGATTALSGSATLIELVSSDGTAGNTTAAADDVINVLDANGDTITSITVGSLTIDSFLATLATGSNGAITGSFDAGAQTITYASDAGFQLQYVDTSAPTAANAQASKLVGEGASGTGRSTGVAGAAAEAGYGLATGGSVSAGGGAASVSIRGFDFRTTNGGALASLANLDVQTNAASAVSAIDTAITTLNDGLAQLGSQARALDIQKDFLQVLSDNVEKGIGALVDADLAKESARLQSLQIKQQLGVQALSIANQSPQLILSLFRG